MNQPFQPARLRRQGFSLVEVTISLGLVTFAAMSVMALLPTGLSVMRSAMDQTIEAQIVRTIAGQAVVSNYDNLTAASPLYFDDEGMPVRNAGDAVYTVTLGLANPDFPGVNGLSDMTRSLTRLNIGITEQRGGPDSRRTSVHSIKVANHGK